MPRHSNDHYPEIKKTGSSQSRIGTGVSKSWTSACGLGPAVSGRALFYCTFFEILKYLEKIELCDQLCRA
jgi:hypothetical protein